jgi:hypothetical protein
MNKPYVPSASVQQKAERELERLRRALGVERSDEDWLADLDAKKKKRRKQEKA